MRSLVTAVALMAIASTAHGQTLDAPTYMVGDTWTLKEGVWFAPAVKLAVKTTSTSRNARDVELLSYRVQSSAAATAPPTVK